MVKLNFVCQCCDATLSVIADGKLLGLKDGTTHTIPTLCPRCKPRVAELVREVQLLQIERN